MKIHFGTDDFDRFFLRAEASGHWDGRPTIDKFLLDHQPMDESRERIAVASSLLFGSYFGGLVNFSSQINLVTANAIQEFVPNRHIHIDRIEERPKAIPAHHGRMWVTDNLQRFSTLLTTREKGDRILGVVSSTEFTGSSAAPGALIVPCNAQVFGPQGGDDYFKSVLAAAVLLASDFEAGVLSLQLDNAHAAEPTPAVKRKITSLLGAVSLGVTWEDVNLDREKELQSS